MQCLFAGVSQSAFAGFVCWQEMGHGTFGRGEVVEAHFLEQCVRLERGGDMICFGSRSLVVVLTYVNWYDMALQCH